MKYCWKKWNDHMTNNAMWYNAKNSMKRLQRLTIKDLYELSIWEKETSIYLQLKASDTVTVEFQRSDRTAVEQMSFDPGLSQESGPRQAHSDPDPPWWTDKQSTHPGEQTGLPRQLCCLLLKQSAVTLQTEALLQYSSLRSFAIVSKTLRPLKEQNYNLISFTTEVCI